MDSDLTLKELQRHIRSTLRSIHDLEYTRHVRGPTERTEMDKMLREVVFTYLYFSISNGGQSLPVLFPRPNQKISEEGNEGVDFYPRSYEDVFSAHKVADSVRKPFYSVDESRSHKSHKHTGRSCGRKFLVGEPIYRCLECGYDDTCVLCIDCFNPMDHKGHHVYTEICADFNTGICDCGDPEAWNNTLHCKAEEDEVDDVDSVDFSDEKYSGIFEIVLSEVFDYFIDVFNQNIEPLPTLQKDITLKLREMIQQGKLMERAEFLKALAYKNEFIMSDSRSPDNIDEVDVLFKTSIPSGLMDLKNYTVIIYNDEYHNYSQATTALRQGVPDNKHTDLLASKIDSEGRAMLKCSTNLSDVIGGFFAVQTNGLSATLTTWSEYIHQETCKYIISWLSHCLNVPNPSFQNSFRSSMGKVLCSEYTEASNTVDVTRIIQKYFGNKCDETNPCRFADLSVLDEGNKIPFGHHKILAETSLDSISNNINEVYMSKSRAYTNSRLQHIFYFDNRYWKKLRKSIQNVIIPTLSSSNIYKPLFCAQVVEIFNHISRSVAYMDREPQLTALRECVVQLFTCPTNAMMIFNSGAFKDVLWSVIDIFREFSKLEGGLLVWQRVQKSNPTNSYTLSFRQGLYAVETLLSKVTDCNILLKPAEFISIVTLCKLFNGAWKIKRKEGEHVLHENQHFIPYSEYTTSIYTIIDTIDKILDNSKTNIDLSLLLNAIKLLTTFLGHRSLSYAIVDDSQDIIKFEVHKDRVAFMNPVHTLFSFLIEKAPLNSALKATTGCSDFLIISDFALRSVVLCAQIDVGFWVRNGMSVLHQSSYYKNNPELSSYTRDIHLNQLAFLRESDDIPRVIYNTLDRWELLKRFKGDVDFDKTIYEDKINPIIQQFIAFIYQVLTERQFFVKFPSAKEKKIFHIENAIMHTLCNEPVSYSKLLRSIPDYLTEDAADLESALKKVSVFVEPTGLADSGVFKLKNEYYSKVDPLKLLNIANEFETSAAIIKGQLAKGKKEIAKVVLQPQILPPDMLDGNAGRLGEFTRTDLFAKLIYKLLQVSIERSDGAFLYELLHLIHAIFKDDELVNGKDSVPKAYLSKSICNQLLLISNASQATFSDFIRRKADYLLENMILKRPAEIFDSLITSFGHQYVEDYKAKRVDQGIKLEEDEKARKKRLVKKRQEKLLAKFNNQQKKFMKENESTFTHNEGSGNDYDADMKDESLYESEDFACSLCQDDTSTDLFVMPVYHDHTPIFRPGDILNPKEFATEWTGFFQDDQKLTYHDDETLKVLQNNGSLGSRKVVVSCNHSIHHSCFKRYVHKKRFSTNAFICPLCQTYSNCVLPIRPTSKVNTGLTLDSLVNEEISVDILSKLFGAMSAAEFKNVYSTFNLVNLHSHSYDRTARNTPGFENKDTSFILSVHWANTVSMLEIASRLDSPTDASFLRGKEQKYKTLKYTLVSILLMCYGIGKPNPSFDPYADLDVIWHENQLFQYIVKKCLYSNESLKDTVSRAFAHYSKQHLDMFISGLQSKDTELLYNKALSCGGLINARDAGVLSALRMIIAPQVNDPKLLSITYDLAYTSLIKNILPTIRRCLILLKVFHDLLKDKDDDEFIINDTVVEEIIIPSDLPRFVDGFLKVTTHYNSLSQLLCVGCAKLEPSNERYLQNIPFEYSGVIKLINLAKYLNTYVTNTKRIGLREEHSAHLPNAKNRLDFKICLTCGVKVHLRMDRQEMSKHLCNYCFKPFGAFLVPNTNEVCLYLLQPASKIYVSAPYLNSHGEAGRNAMKRGDLTTLNLKRYEYLNKLWINNEIPGYISRVMGDEFRVNILSNGYIFTFNRNFRLRRAPTRDDGEDDDFDDDAEPFGGHSSDEDERDIEMVDDRIADLGDGAFLTNMGNPEITNQENGTTALNALDNIRNAIANGFNGGDAPDPARLLYFFPPEMRGLNVLVDMEEDDEILDNANDAESVQEVANDHAEHGQEEQEAVEVNNEEQNLEQEREHEHEHEHQHEQGFSENTNLDPTV